MKRPIKEIPESTRPPVNGEESHEARGFDGERLDYRIKRAGTFGGLGVAGILYVVGVLVILKLMAIWPFDCAPVAEITQSLSRVVECARAVIGDGGWQGLGGVMLALFSVPTILMIAVLRAASPKSDPLPDSVYTTVADRLTSAIERALEARK